MSAYGKPLQQLRTNASSNGTEWFTAAPEGTGVPGGAANSAQYQVDATTFGGALGLSFPAGTFAVFDNAVPPKWDNVGVFLTLQALPTVVDKVLTLPDTNGVLAVTVAGATIDRPVAPLTGFLYFDADLGLPVWWDGAGWVNALGAPA